jgi:hypothetical protein
MPPPYSNTPLGYLPQCPSHPRVRKSTTRCSSRGCVSSSARRAEPYPHFGPSFAASAIHCSRDLPVFTFNSAIHFSTIATRDVRYTRSCSSDPLTASFAVAMHMTNGLQSFYDQTGGRDTCLPPSDGISFLSNIRVPIRTECVVQNQKLVDKGWRSHGCSLLHS